MKTNQNRITKLASTRPFRQVSDRRVRRELRRATLHAALAARRARDIGAARATGDRRVTRGFQRSSLHAVRALSFSINPPPARRPTHIEAVRAIRCGKLCKRGERHRR